MVRNSCSKYSPVRNVFPRKIADQLRRVDTWRAVCRRNNKRLFVANDWTSRITIFANSTDHILNITCPWHEFYNFENTPIYLVNELRDYSISTFDMSAIIIIYTLWRCATYTTTTQNSNMTSTLVYHLQIYLDQSLLGRDGVSSAAVSQKMTSTTN